MIMIQLFLTLVVGLGTADVTEITTDTTLDPAKTYGPLVVKASNVTIDGKGATIQGATEGNPKTFKGVGISARGVSNVTLRNVVVKGFETGLHVSDASGWTVEGCNFSGNFHDPEFGWGENGRRGGILLERVKGSTFRKNRANRNWDACTLVDSNANVIEENDFSFTSDTCLKLWHSSSNTVEKNNLSYGLRIKKGEVHARDSTGVLLESGSNANTFRDNDVTHGGDGIFIRVLNGWVSVANVFERNDCSYANNNGFEAWSPHNTYRGNTANHCSYGFWLGASDNTILEGNEASFNGELKGFHNSPHLPKDGHAGIVFMFGPSSHTLVRGNTCKNNNGAGIALIGEPPKFKAYHWVIEDNVLERNRWGIYARHADWIDMADNTFDRNQEAGFSRDATVTNVFESEAKTRDIDRWAPRLAVPKPAKVGEPMSFAVELRAPKAKDGEEEADDVDVLRTAKFRWDFGDGPKAGASTARHAFDRPGPHRVGLTTTLRGRSDPQGFVVYALDDLPEIGGNAGSWTWSDTASKVAFEDDAENGLIGGHSVRASVKPYGGGRVNLVCSPEGGVKVEGKSSLIFWVKTRNENVTGWQGPNPIVTLKGKGGELKLTAKVDRLQQPEMNESRGGWARFEVPLAGGDGWERAGEMPKVADGISIGFDSWGNDPLTIWIDGLAVR
jgi:parallel beta-helix repeat protein